MTPSASRMYSKSQMWLWHRWRNRLLKSELPSATKKTIVLQGFPGDRGGGIVCTDGGQMLNGFSARGSKPQRVESVWYQCALTYLWWVCPFNTREINNHFALWPIWCGILTNSSRVRSPAAVSTALSNLTIACYNVGKTLHVFLELFLHFIVSNGWWHKIKIIWLQISLFWGPTWRNRKLSQFIKNNWKNQ